MSVIRNAWIEFKGLWRVVGWAAVAAVAAMVFIVQAQEPSFLRHIRVEFFWPSVQVLLAVALCALPIVWSMSRRVHRGWAGRCAIRPMQSVVASWLGMVAVGLALTGVAMTVIYTVQRIYGVPSTASRLLEFGFRALCVLLPITAIGPAFSGFGPSAGRLALVWSAVLATSAGVFGIGLPIPLDRFLGDRIDDAATVASVLLQVVGTTAGGLVASTIVVGARKGH